VLSSNREKFAVPVSVPKWVIGMLSGGIAGSSSSASMGRPIHRDFCESSKARGSRCCRIALHCRNAQLVAVDPRDIYLRRARITPHNRRGKTSPAATRRPSRIASSILTWSGYMASESTAVPSKSRAPATRFASRTRRRLRLSLTMRRHASEGT
jgi:hypothetical protein